MKVGFAESLQCPWCHAKYRIEIESGDGDAVRDGTLVCSCERTVPVIHGIPRILPTATAWTLASQFPALFEQQGTHPRPPGQAHHQATARTLRAFGDEWQRFPELLKEHEKIFHWYFQGPVRVPWKGLRVLDAGCGMGRWLHFAKKNGANVVGMDVSAAIDVAAARDADGAEFVQADLRWPPFPPESFDLVYCLGVLHHLEDPLAGVHALAPLVRRGGELRIYVYRTLDDEPGWKRALFHMVTVLRRITTRLPYTAVHAVAWLVAAIGSIVFIGPRHVLRRWPWGDRLTRGLPLVHYEHVPFRMLVAEQFDRLVAPIEGRFRGEDVAAWLREVGFDIVAILPGLGWRAIGQRPVARHGDR